ncbi:MAG: type II toxin-antitoxin system RelB/DinJ family antitoxin [Candidatus Peregrinibacteria bacterium]|nr:type II toxin-antitoxin system RelB/DinJ family antitoxin [Candidatus Peregrinibacteria bacterium]
MSGKSAMIRARIEPKTKDKAEGILKNLGLNPTEAISMFYYQIIIKKGIPFDISLESGDIPENYTEIKSDSELKSLLNLK